MDWMESEGAGGTAADAASEKSSPSSKAATAAVQIIQIVQQGDEKKGDSSWSRPFFHLLEVDD